MLASRVKHQEVETLRDLWDAVGIGYAAALRTENPTILRITQELEQRALWWKERIATHDYTEDERIYKLFP